MPMSNQSQKADILLYIIHISIIKLGNELRLVPGKVKQQPYEALIITRASFCCAKILKKLHLFLTKVALNSCIYFSRKLQ